MADVTDTDYAAEAIKGQGGQWLIGSTGSPQVFDAVYGVRRITPGGTTTNIIDKTHLRSPNNHTEKMAGRRDSDAFEIEMIYNPNHESHNNTGGGSGAFASGGLFAMNIAQTELDMKIKLADGSPANEIAFRGIVADLRLGEISDQELVTLIARVMPLQDWTGDLN
jgi:hypothetical protein